MSSSADRLSDELVDFTFPLSGFIAKHSAYLDSQRFAAMNMDDSTVSLRDVRFFGSCNIKVGTSKERWRHWGSCDLTVSLFDSPYVNTRIVRCNDEVDYKMTVGQLVSPMCELAMTEFLLAAELIIFWMPFESFYLLSN